MQIQRLFCALIAFLVVLTLQIHRPAIAAAPICKAIDGHQVCLRKIKRSAKNYWEYWALVEVDGQRRPKETYNCRDRFLIDEANILVPFEREFTGDFVCQLYVDKQTYLDRRNPPPFLSSE